MATMSTAMKLVNIGSSSLECYDPDTMDFLKWLNHFEYIVDFLHIQNNLKVEFLLKFMNSKALSHIQRRVAPANPLYLPYEVLINCLEELYACYKDDWAANYRFMYRAQFIGESVGNYLRTLKRILKNASPFLISGEILKRRFVDGLKDDKAREILLNCKTLTLEKAINIAEILELYPPPSKTN
ncbi:hypothetical protein M0804_013275 [Polistes exclamans]|nr:hypothetical protein M0804_013275 [Polistes exclamans]